MSTIRHAIKCLELADETVRKHHYDDADFVANCQARIETLKFALLMYDPADDIQLQALAEKRLQELERCLLKRIQKDKEQAKELSP